MVALTSREDFLYDAAETSIEQLESDVQKLKGLLEEVLPVLRKNGYGTLAAKIEKRLKA